MKGLLGLLLIALACITLVRADEDRKPGFMDRLKGLTKQTDELALLNKPDCLIKLTGGIDGVEKTIREQTQDGKLWMVMIASNHDATSVAAAEQYYNAVRAFCDPEIDGEAKDKAGNDIEAVDEADRERVTQLYRFALLSFDDESELTWRWWIWKIPVVLFITPSSDPAKRFYDVQFWKIAWQIPNTNRLIGAIKQVLWREQLPVWESGFAPGGHYDTVALLFAHGFNAIYDILDPIPRWLLALIGSTAGSMLLSYLHRNDSAQQQQQQQQQSQSDPGQEPDRADKKGAQGGGGKKTQ